MKIDSKIILTFAAYLAALGVIGTTAWAIGEVTGLRPALIRELNEKFKIAMDQTQLNTIAITKQEFNILEERLKRDGILTWDEKRDYCTFALILKYPVDDSNGFRCTSDGIPDLVTRSKAR